MRIEIETNFLRAALQAVSKEETRYYLNGVFLDARGFIAATNGHIAFAARCADAHKLAEVRPSSDSSNDALPGIIVPLAAAQAASKGKDILTVVGRDGNGLWWLVNGSLRQHFEPIDASFPDWQRIIPEVPDVETAAHYDPQYIKAMGEMARALRDGKKYGSTSYHIHQVKEAPGLVTFTTFDPATGTASARLDCCAVIMPMRAKGTDGFSRSVFLRGAGYTITKDEK